MGSLCDDARIFWPAEEYPHKLPNPRLFPLAKGREACGVWEFQGVPDVFTDGCIIDCKVREGDKKRLRQRAKMCPMEVYTSLVDKARQASDYLPEPTIIYDSGDGFVCYAFLLGERSVAMQVKYFNYFRNRYPGCKFYAGDPIDPGSVKVGDDIVGVWSSALIPGQDDLKKTRREQNEMG